MNKLFWVFLATCRLEVLIICVNLIQIMTDNIDNEKVQLLSTKGHFFVVLAIINLIDP